MVVKQITKRDFYVTYFKVQALNGYVKLTNTEIRVLAAIITFNDDRLRPYTPYASKGREELLEELNLQASAFSNALSKLAKKGLLVKLAKKGDYALSTKVKKLKEYVDSNSQISIATYYEITDADNIRRSSKETEPQTV